MKVRQGRKPSQLPVMTQAKRLTTMAVRTAVSPTMSAIRVLLMKGSSLMAMQVPSAGA